MWPNLPATPRPICNHPGVNLNKPESIRAGCTNKQGNTSIVFHGTVPGLSCDCPGIFLGILVIFPSFLKKERQHINNFDPHPFPGQSPQNCICLLFLLSPEGGLGQPYKGRKRKVDYPWAALRWPTKRAGPPYSRKLAFHPWKSEKQEQKQKPTLLSKGPPQTRPKE